MAMMNDAIDVGTGDVFKDLGFADAQERKLRTELAIRLNDLIKERKLTQTAAAEIFGISPVARLGAEKPQAGCGVAVASVSVEGSAAMAVPSCPAGWESRVNALSCHTPPQHQHSTHAIYRYHTRSTACDVVLRSTSGQVSWSREKQKTTTARIQLNIPTPSNNRGFKQSFTAPDHDATYGRK